MPMPRIPFKTGNSARVMWTPSSSSLNTAMAARMRVEELHAGQPLPSREMPSGGRSHSAPQILQRNFPETENVKRSPPVTIVDDLDRNFLVAVARSGLFQQCAMLRKIRERRHMRHERRPRIRDDFMQVRRVIEIGRA